MPLISIKVMELQQSPKDYTKHAWSTCDHVWVTHRSSFSAMEVEGILGVEGDIFQETLPLLVPIRSIISPSNPATSTSVTYRYHNSPLLIINLQFLLSWCLYCDVNKELHSDSSPIALSQVPKVLSGLTLGKARHTWKSH